MIRAPYIKWNKLSEEVPKTKSPDEKKKVYIVATPNQAKKYVEYTFAEYCKKGEIISIPYLRNDIKATEEELAQMTMEERLLTAIFGKELKYEIPEDGFYVKKSAQDLCRFYGETYEIFSDCEYGMLKLDNDAFWSESPIAPEGFCTEAEYSEQVKADTRLRRKKMEEEYCEEAEKSLTENEFISLAYRNVTHELPVSFEKQEIRGAYGAIYNMSTVQLHKNAETASEFINLFTVMKNKKIAFTDFAQYFGEKIESNKDLTIDECRELIHNYLDPIFDEAKLSQTARQLAWTAFVDNRYRSNDIKLDNVIGDGECRRKALAQYNNDRSKLPEILLSAEGRHYIAQYSYRVSNLMNLNAPEIIVENEYRIMAKGIMTLLSLPRLIGVDEEVFGKYFGVTSDYKKYICPKEEPEDDSEETQADYEVDESIIEQFFDDEDEEEEEPYYAVYNAPAYKLFDGRCAVFCTAKNEYYTDETGDTPVFGTYADAEEYIKTLPILE